MSELIGDRVIPLPFTEGSTNHYVTGIGASRDGNLWVIAEARVRKWTGQGWGEELGTVPWRYKLCLKRAAVLQTNGHRCPNIGNGLSRLLILLLILILVSYTEFTEKKQTRRHTEG